MPSQKNDPKNKKSPFLRSEKKEEPEQKSSTSDPQQEKPQAVKMLKGELLFSEGDTSQDLYVVQDGTVKIYKTSEDGIQLPLGTVSAGQFVGELSFFDGHPRSATAEAATDILVIKLEKERLEREFSKLPSWMLVLVKSIAYRVRSADELVKRNQIIDQAVSDEFKKL